MADRFAPSRDLEGMRIPDDTPTARAERQLDFLADADRLKSVLRQTSLCDGSRRENSAEHSWHLALMADVLAEYAEPGVDIARVLRMVVVHDLVEIDAGDTFAYDATANVDRATREQLAADRLFGLLPREQGESLRALWDEFELRATPDARFAAALDRLQPLLNNHRSGGGSWRTHAITRNQVLRRMDPIREALPALWPIVQGIVAENCRLGHIRDDPAG
jgi:putative hydrolases of HD superfamily